MATYAVQFVTKQGALCKQVITNRGRAMSHIENALWVNVGCLVIVVTANSGKERLDLRGVAVSQVFHERARAMEWLKTMLSEEAS